MNAVEQRFNVGDLFGAMIFLVVAYGLLGRILHESGRIALSTYNIGLAIVLVCEAVILVAVVVVFG